MRYVGYAALVATFWLLVATFRLILTHECPTAAADVPTAYSLTAPPAFVPAMPPAVVAAIEPPAARRRAWGCSEPLDLDAPPRHSDLRREWPGSEVDPLSKVAVVSGMNAVKPRIAACYRVYQVPGTAMVNVVIAKNGSVPSATVTGKFAGTPTGACVEAAVRAARFPLSAGLSTPYPFQLR